MLVTTSERGSVDEEVEVEEEVVDIGGGGVSVGVVVVVEAKTWTGDDIAAARASAVTLEATCAQPELEPLSPSAAARAGSATEPRRGARGVCPRRRWACVVGKVGDDDVDLEFLLALDARRWSASMVFLWSRGQRREEELCVDGVLSSKQCPELDQYRAYKQTARG